MSKSIEKIYLKASTYIAKKYFFYDSDVVLLSSGTRGSAFVVDDGKKILKITDDVDEALRAERIRSKHFRNLIGYYDIRRIKSSNIDIDRKYCLLMDKLPKVLTDDENCKDIYHQLDRMYNVAFDYSRIPGYDISDAKKLRKFIKDELSERVFYERLSDEYKVIAERMYFDIIQIRKQLRKCGIVTNDLTVGNLGFDKMGNLIFYDMGYPGEGRKQLKPNKEVQVQFEPKVKEEPKFKIKKLKPKVVESFNNFVLFESIEVEI